MKTRAGFSARLSNNLCTSCQFRKNECMRRRTARMTVRYNLRKMRRRFDIGTGRYKSPAKSRIALLFLLLLVPVFWSPVSWCRLESDVSAAALTQSANYILTGEVVEVHPVGAGTLQDGGKSYPATRMAAVVKVGEVLKGTIPGHVIQVEFLQNQDAENGPITDGLTAPSYRLFFLNAAAKNFVFANREHGSLPISQAPADLPRIPDSETYSRVLASLAKGLLSPESSAQERTSSLRVLAMEPPATYLDEIFRAALKSPDADSDPDFRLELLAIMTRRHDETALPELEKELFAWPAGEHINARTNMILSLQFIDGAKAVPILAHALLLPDSALRQNAAMALQNTNSPAAIDPLLQALHDEDREVQFAVMQSLGSLNHELEWRPNSVDPGPNWDACLEHWEQVAKSREPPNSP
jgi:HEAT repeats